MPHGPADHLPGEQVDDGAPVPARMCAMTAHWPTPGVRIEHTADSNRCKVDIEIAAMDGGDEPQAVRSTDHWHAIASGLVCASSALTGGPWGISQSADFFFAEIALPSAVRRSASVCFTDTPR